jgi:flavin-binding protein dodecin
MIDVTAAIEDNADSPQCSRHWRRASSMGSKGRGGFTAPEHSQSDPTAPAPTRDWQLIGVSTESPQDAARNAVETAASTVRDLRIAEVVRQDLTIENGRITGFRVRLAVSFKYETGD